MPNERYKIFIDINTNEEMIVDRITDEHLTLTGACERLNKQDDEIQHLKEKVNKVNNIIEKLENK